MGKKKNKRETKDFITGIFGLSIMVWEIFIYRKTIIPLWVLFAIIGIIGTYTTWRDYKSYMKAYANKGNLFFATMQNTVAWGFTICSFFMILNFYLANSKTRTRTFNIEEFDSMSGSKGRRGERKPIVRIDYDGQLKELVFPTKYFNKLDEYEQVTLVTKRGRFGFDIITEQHLY
jgi:hypothetical protein